MGDAGTISAGVDRPSYDTKRLVRAADERAVFTDSMCGRIRAGRHIVGNQAPLVGSKPFLPASGM